MNGLVRYVRETRLKKPDLILGIILCSILFFLYELIPMPDSLFYSQVEIGNGYIAKKDLDGNIYVVDQEHERIIKMDGKHRVLHTITKSTKGKDAISYVGGYSHWKKWRPFCRGGSLGRPLCGSGSNSCL